MVYKLAKMATVKYISYSTGYSKVILITEVLACIILFIYGDKSACMFLLIYIATQLISYIYQLNRSSVVFRRYTQTQSEIDLSC